MGDEIPCSLSSFLIFNYFFEMKKIYAILAYLAIAGSASAQIRVYDVANQPSEQTEEHNPGQGSTLKQDVKLNLGGLLNGVLMVNYEHMIIDKITVEGGIGITMKDILYEYMSTSSDDRIGTNSHQYGAGFAVEGSLRIFPMDIDEMSGFYGQVTYRYRKYELKQTNNIGRTFNDKIIAFGQQLVGDYGFLLDYSVGFNLYTVKEPVMPYRGGYPDEKVIISEKSDIGIQFCFAMKFGYTF